MVIAIVTITAYIVAGTVVLVLHGRQKLPAHVSDMFDMILFATPELFIFVAVLLWPLPLILGAVASMFALKTSLKSGDGKE